MRTRSRLVALLDFTEARRYAATRPIARRILTALERASMTAVVTASVRFIDRSDRIGSPEHLSAVLTLIVALFVIGAAYLKIRSSISFEQPMRAILSLRPPSAYVGSARRTDFV